MSQMLFRGAVDWEACHECCEPAPGGPWPSKQLHGALVSAALDGARALAASPQGGALRTVSNVFLRCACF